MTTPDQQNKPGRFEPTWDSLSQYTMPQWLRDAKFGVYTHWGPYSVPAYARAHGTDWPNPNGTWYGHKMYKEGLPEHNHHIETYGDTRTFGYKDLESQQRMIYNLTT